MVPPYRPNIAFPEKAIKTFRFIVLFILVCAWTTAFVLGGRVIILAADSVMTIPDKEVEGYIEDIQPECVNGYLFYNGLQMSLTRDMPVICGSFRQEFADWLASQPKMTMDNKGLASLWNQFLLEKFVREGTKKTH